MPRKSVLFIALTLAFVSPPFAQGAERLCDATFEDCRTPLLNLIRGERIGIDVAFWFMEDTRYSAALIERWRAGVPVRVIMDTEANAGYGNEAALRQLRDAGIPMLEKTSGGIVHWKMMLFAGQNTVEFSGANFSPHAFVPTQPYVDFVDEVIYFSDDPAIVNSFKRRYDDVWTTTSGYTPYANLSGMRTRSYALFGVHADMNFPPYNDFRSRSLGRYNAETQAIDSIMFRITDRRHTDTLIAAMRRGVPVRLITDEDEYRDPSRLWHAYNVDLLYASGAQVRLEGHLGSLHQKSTLLRGQRMTIFGSSNWTSPSATYQLEHNIFTTKPLLYAFFSDQFERKWNNQAGHSETKPFVPLPPRTPRYVRPSNAATSQPLSVTLAWDAGAWAHKYDIYFGTSSTPPLLARDLELGPSQTSTDYVTYQVTGLQDGVTYYWRIVSKTMANVARSGQVWSFRTSGHPIGALPTGWTSRDIGPVGRPGSASENGGTFTLRGAGADVWGAGNDAFQYAYRSLSGDGSIVARVASISGSEAWTKVGVMIRASTSDSSAHAFMLVSTGKGLAFQRRRSAGGLTTHTSGGSATAPRWVRLSRAGSRITAYVSSTGTSWSVVGSDTISLPSSVLVGLAVSSHTTSSLATGTFDNVSVAGAIGSAVLPSGWQARDVGSVGATGSASYSSGTFTVRGSGDDIWGTSDAFHFAYRSLSGDGTIVARVPSLAGSEAWIKVGVMIRSSIASNAAYAFMLVSKAKGLAFQRRTSTGASAMHTSGGTGTVPRWVRLTRSGGNVSAYRSTDGSAWTLLGTDVVALPSTALAGLAVTSHSAGTLATGAFERVGISGGG